MSILRVDCMIEQVEISEFGKADWPPAAASERSGENGGEEVMQ